MGAYLYGVPQQQARLRRSSGGPGYRKVITKVLRRGIQVVAKAQQAAVPKGLKSVKAALGSRVLKASEGNKAKAGAAVAKKKKNLPPENKGRKGVGMSARNVMWYVMGTGMRETGSKRIRAKSAKGQRLATGGKVHSTGKMPAHPFIKQAGMQARTDANAVMGQELREGLRALWKGGG